MISENMDVENAQMATERDNFELISEKAKRQFSVFILTFIFQ